MGKLTADMHRVVTDLAEYELKNITKLKRCLTNFTYVSGCVRSKPGKKLAGSITVCGLGSTSPQCLQGERKVSGEHLASGKGKHLQSLNYSLQTVLFWVLIRFPSPPSGRNKSTKTTHSVGETYI